MAKASGAICRRLTDHPGYRQAEEKDTQLKAELDGLVKEIQDHDQQRAAVDATGGVVAEALTLLDGGDGVETAPSLEETAELQRRVEILTEAITIQAGRLTKLRQVASLEICKEFRPRYEDVHQHMATKAVEFIESVGPVLDQRNQLSGNGIAFSSNLPQVSLERFNPTDPDSLLNRFVDEVESTTGIKVSRPMLEAEEALREKSRQEEGKRKNALDKAERVQREKAVKLARKQADKDARDWFAESA